METSQGAFLSAGLIHAVLESGPSWPWKGLNWKRNSAAAVDGEFKRLYSVDKKDLLPSSSPLFGNSLSLDVTAAHGSLGVLAEIFRHVDRSGCPNRSAVTGCFLGKAFGEEKFEKKRRKTVSYIRKHTFIGLQPYFSVFFLLFLFWFCSRFFFFLPNSKTCCSAFKDGKQVAPVFILEKGERRKRWLAISPNKIVRRTNLMITHQQMCFPWPKKKKNMMTAFKFKKHSSTNRCNDSHSRDEKQFFGFFFFWRKPKLNRPHESQIVFLFSFPV